MKYILLTPLVVFILVNLFSVEALAYPSCNFFFVNTTAQNSSWVSSICSWSGGNLYLSWEQGKYYGFQYNVSAYQNPNVTFVQAGGNTYSSSKACRVTLAQRYYPKSNYLKEVKWSGVQENDSCQYTSGRLGVSPQPTTTIIQFTTGTTSIPTTSLPTTTNPTTTLSITTALPTPSLQISANTIYAGSSVTATVRGLSSSDAVELIMNGNVVVSGLGSASYNPILPVGNYSFVAYDVNRHSYSDPLEVYVLIPTTVSTVSTATIQSISISSTISSTTVQQNLTNSTGKGSGGSNWLFTIGSLIIVVGIIYGVLQYSKMKGGGATPHANAVSPAPKPPETTNVEMHGSGSDSA